MSTYLLTLRAVETYGDYGEWYSPTSFDGNFHFLTLPNSSDLMNLRLCPQQIVRCSGVPGTSHVSTAAATIVLSIDESAKTILLTSRNFLQFWVVLAIATADKHWIPPENNKSDVIG